MLYVLRLVLYFFQFLCLMCVGSNSVALSVYPTKIKLSPEASINALTLSNESTKAILLQIQLFEWTQKDGKDVFKPTDLLIATPPIFTIPAVNSQMIRVGLTKPLFSKDEKTYRLVIEEIPSKKIPVKVYPLQLNMVLKLSLPVIVEGLGPVKEKITWSTFQNNKGKLYLSAQNEGNNLVFISMVQGLNKKQRPITPQETTFAYLLPGSKQTWQIKNWTKQRPSYIQALVNQHLTLTHVS